MPADLPARVLVVEDCLDDERITLRALQKGGLRVEVRVVRDGQEASTVLGLDGNAPVYEPDLVLLSLDDACDEESGMVERARQEPRLARVPIVVLATYVDAEAAARCLAAGASAHATKPIHLDAYTKMVQAVLRSWINAPTDSLKAP